MGVSIVDTLALGVQSGRAIPQNQGELQAPRILAVESVGGIAAPRTATSQATGSLAAPRSTTVQSAGSLAAPRTTTSQASGSLAAPRVAATQSQIGLAAPRVFQAQPTIRPDQDDGAISIVDSMALTPSYPIKNGRILYKNDFATATASPTAAQAVTVPNTFERWRPAGGTQTLTLTRSSPTTIDAIGIGASVFNGATLQIQVSPTASAGFTTVETVFAFDDRAVLVLLTAPITAQRVRIILTGGSNREIGVVYAGIALQMERPLLGGHSPINLSPRTEYQSNTSDSGNWLGRSITREGLEAELTWKYISNAWYRNEFLPFTFSAKKEPFFIAWRPSFAPNDVAYAHTTADIVPSYSSTRDLMDLSISIRGYGDR